VAAYVGKSYSYDFVRKLYGEIQQGRGPICIDKRGQKRPAGKNAIPSFSRRRKLIQNLDLDPCDHKITLGLGSHFNTGGLRVNEKTETSVEGLFAAGEVIGGLHGGLRLAGYSFTQMIVFGIQAGRQAAHYARSHKHRPDLPEDDLASEKSRIYRFLQPEDAATTLSELKPMLQRVMNEDVFIEKDRTGLTRAISRINEIQESAKRLRVSNFKRFNLQWARAIEFIWLIKTAEIIARSALLREESRAFHYRTDFPDQDDAHWLTHTVVSLENNQTVIGTAPIEEHPEELKAEA
jgi:succinate dehydrogenase / fumarate reductase flavoprotein subunit